MYMVMIFFLHKMKVESKKLLIMSSAMIATSLVAYLPDTLLITFKVSQRFYYQRFVLISRRLFFSVIIFLHLYYFLPCQVEMSYEAAQITTVTLYYMNSIWNPIIYFCSNRYTREELAGAYYLKCVTLWFSVIVYS